MRNDLWCAALCAAAVFLSPGAGLCQSPAAKADIGVSSAEIDRVSEQMVRDMLQAKMVAARKAPPRISWDVTYFVSTTVVDKEAVVERFRTSLSKYAAGRLVFAARPSPEAIEAERKKIRDGGIGDPELAKPQPGFDFGLNAALSSSDQIDKATGDVRRRSRIEFDMIDLESGDPVWSGLYELTAR